MKIQLNSATGKYDVEVNGQRFSSAQPGYIEYKLRVITGKKIKFSEIIPGPAPLAADSEEQGVSEEFGINTRFSFVETVVKMVATGDQASAVITGEGGLGKSYTVLQTLAACGLRDAGEPLVGVQPNPKTTFIQIKGFSTAKGLYRTLYENNGRTIVFDDIDSILKDAVALNILKGALDSYERRVITWGAESRMGDDELPKSFEFTGRIIFISNMNQNKIDQAIRSRSILIDLSMTTDQKIERMETLIANTEFMPTYDRSVKLEALALISELKNQIREINLRTLITVAKIRNSAGENWKDLAKYTMCN